MRHKKLLTLRNLTILFKCSSYTQNVVTIFLPFAHFAPHGNLTMCFCRGYPSHLLAHLFPAEVLMLGPATANLFGTNTLCKREYTYAFGF